jgi:hypothetical protein
MSTSPFSLPEPSLSGPAPSPLHLASPSQVEPRDGKKMPDIRRQAITAIEALMSLTDPESANEQEQLLAYVVAHPGQPEVALAKHLLALHPDMDRPQPAHARNRTA